jgi:hypothetical protein
MQVLNPYSSLKTEVNTSSLNNVDKLGFMLADKADLDAQVEILKDEIKNQGEGKHVGEYYNASVSLSQRSFINYEAILKELNIVLDPELVKKHTKTSASLACRVTSR